MGGKKKPPPVEGPAIFSAIDRGDDAEVVAMLKEDKSLLNLKNKDGWTPLIACAYCGEAELVSLMLKAGADVKASCRDGGEWGKCGGS